MKSQDILLLLKLVVLAKHEQGAPLVENMLEDRYSVRSLETMTGISKSEISQSIRRSKQVELLIEDHKTGLPKVNLKALKNFIIHGLKYVFPPNPGGIVRGVPTSFAAPVLEDKLMTGGSLIYVWPDYLGCAQGQAVTPLFKSVPSVARQDPQLYRLLALVDAVRLGGARESQLATQLLEKEFAR